MNKMLLAMVMILMVTGMANCVSALEKVRFSNSVRQPMYDLPFLAGEEKGIWKDVGLDVEWIPFRSSKLFFRSISSGKIDIGMVGTTSAIRAIVNGVPQLAVSDLETVYEIYFWVPSASQIKKPSDLKGAKIGVTSLGGMIHSYSAMVTSKLGLEKDVKFVVAGGIRAQVAGLKSGAFDTTMLSFIAMAPLKLKGEVREVLLVKDYLPKDWSENVLVAQKKFITSNPETVRKSIKAFFRAANFVPENRSWAIERMTTTLGYKKDVANAIYLRLNYGKKPKIFPKALENIMSFLVEYGVVPKEKALPAKDLYTTRFIR